MPIMANIKQEEEVNDGYGSDQELYSGLSSEKVQALANSIYGEFRHMMAIYGEDVIKELMPLIVTILEALDRALTECSENVVEIEMLKDDNNQLVLQYDRERQLRRTAEQQLLENEDHNETTTRELRTKVEDLETTNKHLNLKCKNYTDQVERLHERETERKKEYSVLHDRHSEMIQSYMEHIERFKVLQQQQSCLDLSRSPRNKKEDLLLLGNFSSPKQPQSDSGFNFIAESNHNLSHQPVHLHGASTSGSTVSRFTTHSSLKDELPASLFMAPVASQISSTSPTNEHRQDAKTGVCLPSFESGDRNMFDADKKKTLKEVELNREHFAEGFTEEKSQDVVESIEVENTTLNKTTETNESSLFAELSEQDVADIDEGADVLGMSKEVENLINENSKLVATRNSLNVVRDDLTQQVDQLSSQLTLLKEELKQTKKTKAKQGEKLKECEKRIVKLQKDLDNASNDDGKIFPDNGDEVLPMAQRKRFTRAEMARVLIEKNQYKERLLELQEAVRWTETLRASRAHPDISPTKTKPKTTIFQFFSRLFTSSAGDSIHASTSENNIDRLRPSYGSDDVITDLSYQVSTSKALPRSRSAQEQSLYGRSPTIGTFRGEHTLTSDLQASEDEVKTPEDRFEACGWSIPNCTDTTNSRPCKVPVPVFCGPVFGCEVEMKLSCAAALHMSEGLTKDGGCFVRSAASSEKRRNNENFATEKDSPKKAVELLGQDTETDTNTLSNYVQPRNDLSSYIWLVAAPHDRTCSGGSKVYVIDACEPNRCVDTFNVGAGNTSVLCVASIPGTEAEGYVTFDDTTSLQATSNPDLENSMESLASRQDASDQSTTVLPIFSQDLAAEATEDLVLQSGSKRSRDREAVKEHIFTELDNLHPSVKKDEEAVLHEAGKLGDTERVQTSLVSGRVASDFPEKNVTLASLQPTMWLGAENGYIYVHSGITNWRKCLLQIKLKASVLEIVHVKGRVMAALSNGTVAFFQRRLDGVWNSSSYHVMNVGRRQHSIECMCIVYERVWCACRSKVLVVDPMSMNIQSSFNAHRRAESHVTQLAWAGDGVWIAIRSEPIIRLYHARTLQHLQNIAVAPQVSKVLGSEKWEHSLISITALMTSHCRLWIGTNNGIVICVPLSEAGENTSVSTASLPPSQQRPGSAVRVSSVTVSENRPVAPAALVPYCSMEDAQLSFHGFRDAVKFFIAVPGCVTVNSRQAVSSTTSLGKSHSSWTTDGTLVLSGGCGWIDFRNENADSLSPDDEKVESMKLTHGTSQCNHVLVWQLTHS